MYNTWGLHSSAVILDKENILNVHEETFKKTL